MKTNITILFFILLASTLQANILLEKPPLLSEQQIAHLAKTWKTHFTWCLKNKGAVSFCYENGKAGFAVKFLSIPLYYKNYRILPTIQELKNSIHGRDYYFDIPLAYTKTKPTPINKKELDAFMANKKCIFYTGAGISAQGNVATMRTLEKSLKMDCGIKKFLQTAWHSPKEIQNAFADFCHTAINNKPTAAHYALKQLSLAQSAAIITENVDLLQHRTGIKPLSTEGDHLKSVSATDWQQVDAIICIGLSQDDKGLLSWYKRHHPQGILIAINYNIPNYISDNDYIYLGDLQEILSEYRT